MRRFDFARAVGLAAFMGAFVLPLAVTAAVTTTVHPAWSARFDQIQDPALIKKLQDYRSAGWAATFKALGKGKSAAELTAQANLTLSDLKASIAADQALLVRNKEDLNALHPSAAECQQARSGAIFAACDLRLKTDQVIALQGLLELLPAYSSLLPPPPKIITHGIVSGKVVATMVIQVQRSLFAPRPAQRLTIAPVTRKLVMESGDTLVVDTTLNQGSQASGFTITPAVGVLQPVVGRTHSELVYLRAVGAGVVTIKFFGPWHRAATCSGPSNKWSGYVVNTVPVTGITGSWVVPTVAPLSSSGLSSSWIGIDGCGEGSQLIQTGTEQDMNGGAFGIGAGPSYGAWWEVLPQFGSTQSYSGSTPVFPGDLMTASIVPIGAPTPNNASSWVLTLTDTTQGWTNSTTQTFNGSLDEAEWIEEATTSCFLGCSVAPLADYQTVTFDPGDTLSVSGGAPKNPGFFSGERIVMNAGSADFSTPSNPDCDTDGFTAVPGLLAPAPPGPLFSTTGYPQGTVGVPYSQTLGTTGAASIRLDSGSVPGLVFANGNLSGVPTTPGRFDLSLTALDVNGNQAVTCTQSVVVTIGTSQIVPPPPTAAFSELVITLLTGNDDLRNDSDLQVSFTGINGFPANLCLVQGNSGNVVAGSACSGGPAGDWNPVVGSWNGWPAWQQQVETRQFPPGTLTYSGSGSMTITFSTHNTGCGFPFGGCGTYNDNWDIEALRVDLVGSPIGPSSINLFNVGNFGAPHNSGTCFRRVKAPGGHDPNSVTITWTFPPAPSGDGCPND